MARGRKPGTTRESRENQLINLAINLVEKRLRDGSATSSEILHYLKLGTTREQLEQERLRHENELSQAKTNKIRADQESVEKIDEVLKAIRTYSGYGSDDE